MRPYLIAASCVYGLVLIAYSAVKIRPDIIARRILKVALATIYLALSVIGVVLSGGGLSEIAVLSVCLFAWLGDCLLLAPRTFHKGVAAFFIAHVCLAAFQLYAAINIGWQIYSYIAVAAIFAIIYGAFVVMQVSGVCRLKKYAAGLNTYMALVTINGAMGIILIAGGLSEYLLMGIGALLFMTSDYFLGAYMNKWKKYPLTVINSLFYFTGMFLISISCYA